MKFSIKSAAPDKQRCACLVVGVFEGGKMTAAAEQINEASEGRLAAIIRHGDMRGKTGSTLLIHALPSLAAERVLLVGLGKQKEFGDKAYLTAVRSTIKVLNASGATDAALFLSLLPVGKRNVDWRIRQAVIAASETAYRFDAFKSKPDDKPALGKITLMIDAGDDNFAAKTALAQAQAIADGIALAKNLGNRPGNVCTPTHLADIARELAKEYALDCHILESEEMAQLGMNTLLSVAKGSHQAPKLIVLGYRGRSGRKKAAPLVLVGKGVTFDSGGISLKPGEGMDEMKFDMCGAASVLGTLKAVAAMKLPINLTVIVPAVENMPGGAASKPGDIVTSMSGQTVEILNTDAEGRLILCDALTYAERFKPETVIDVATLTGACVIALGHVASGLFTEDETLATELLAASEVSLDRAWRMPLWDDYQESLKSNFADMANIGGRPGGSITAACFLSRFARKFSWAHLDIAGTAWKSGAEKGATGRPVSLLSHYLIERAGKTN